MRYPSARDALNDALRLARAMTLKCSLAGLDAGGGKAVVLVHDGLQREAAFTRLGQIIEELGGMFRTAGDLGTTAADLEAMARSSRYVHTDERHLAAAVGRGILRCIEACAAVRGVAPRELVVGIQGVGSIGASTAHALAEAGSGSCAPGTSRRACALCCRGRDHRSCGAIDEGMGGVRRGEQRSGLGRCCARARGARCAARARSHLVSGGRHRWYCAIGHAFQ
jgi:Glu/Leu/Phe/Val dehydrogenase, dimerisation domain